MKKTVVKVIEANQNRYKVKFPFLEVPIEMDKNFFTKYMNNKVYQFVNKDNKHIEKNNAIN